MMRKMINYGGAKISSGVGQSEGWNDELTKELLNKMKQAITKPDVMKYKTQLEKFDWSKVNVEKFTPQQCKSQWEKIYKKLRKFKTLSDLIQDSLEYVENPYKGCVKKHPDHPKRPLTPYFRYFLSEREKYAATHRNLSNLEITTILSKKYREITDQEKEKYMIEWKTEMVGYRHRMEQFKNEHPEYYDKDPPTLSRTPLQIFNQESLDSMCQSTKENMTKKQIAESLKNKYHKLDDDQKLPYIMKAIEEWEKYKEELEMFKKSHPDFTASASQKKSVLTIADWRIHDKSLGKPARPPANGYNLFCTRMMVSESMKHLTSRDRIMECGQKWKLLTDSEKQAYQKEFLRLRDNYRLDLKRFIRALTPRQKEEYFRRKKENENKKSKKRKVSLKVKQELSDQSNVSDEDDDDEDEEEDQNTSSSDSSSSEESSEEEEEDEEPPQTENGASSPISAPIRPTTPISALFLYQKVHRQKFAQKNPNMSKSDVTIMLARRFNNLPHQKKLKYIQKEKEQRDLYNEQMRKHQMGEKNGSNSKNPELKPITGEQVYHDQNRENYLKKSNGSKEKAEEAMRRAWTHMNKERRQKFINIAHEKNAKNIAEHLAAQAAAKESNKQIALLPERNLSQKEIKSYLALEPAKVPRDSLTLFRREHRQKLNHLMPNARNKELVRIWNGMPANVKNHYKERVKAGFAEYNRKLQRWLKSLPPQAREVYDATLKKKSEKRKTENSAAKKRKTEAKSSETKAKKVKIKRSQDAESSGNSSDGRKQDSSSDDSDDDSDSSSDSSGSSSDSNSSDSDVPKESSTANQAQEGTQEEESSGDSSSSSSSSGEDSDSD